MEDVVLKATYAASYLTAAAITNRPILLPSSFHASSQRRTLNTEMESKKDGICGDAEFLRSTSRNGGLASSTFFSEFEFAGEALLRQMAAARGGDWGSGERVLILVF